MDSERVIAESAVPTNNNIIKDGSETVIERSKEGRINQNSNNISYDDNSTSKIEIQPNKSNFESNTKTTIKSPDATNRKQSTALTVGRFFSVSFVGSIESGYFESVNDVYIKYSICTGPDWILTVGSDLGVTQISRYKINSKGLRQFVWNQPITISYRTYNYFGWPQIIISVYHFDAFGNDQILGYGCIHLPITNRFPSNYKHNIIIYSPQSTSYFRQLLSWFTRRKPELIDSNLFARGDCRKVLQTIAVGKLELNINLTTKDTSINGYNS